MPCRRCVLVIHDQAYSGSNPRTQQSCQGQSFRMLAQSGKVPFHQSYNVPFPQSYNVPFGKGTESGSTTKHEWQRIKHVGSNATAEREAVEAKGSGGDAGGRRAADQTATAQLSSERSPGSGLETAGPGEHQSAGRESQTEGAGSTRRQVPWLWPDPSVREIGGSGKDLDLGRKCAPADDGRGLVESSQDCQAGHASNA